MRITKIFATLPVFALLLNLATTTPTVAATSEWKNASEKNSGAKVRILSSFYKDDNQQKKLVLGLHFNIENGWHVYGNEAGGIGMPPSLDFKGSTNYKNHKIFWPKAISKKEVIGKETIKYSVYENEVILPVEISLKNAAKPTNLKVKVNYGLCKDICIPASSEFAIDVDNAEDFQSLQEIQKFFEKKIFHEETVSSAKNNEVDEDTSSTDSNQTVEVDNAKHYFPPLLSAIFAALIGGLILNVMPCVLPVLGIKLMSIIKHGDAKNSEIRLAFFATILGILSCFAVFSIFAIIIKFSGNIFNWGLQFQNPLFLTFLIAILLCFIANMLGFFEVNFGNFATNFLNKKISQKISENSIFVPNFLSGILAVLLATPCSAPFLGSAISFSITQNSSTIFLIFMVMGLGLALPYVVLIFSPKLIRLLPKPGNWMIHIKQLLAMLLVATVIWLIYVLSNNIGIKGGIFATIISLLFFAALKIKVKILKNLSLVTLAISMMILPASFENNEKAVNPADMIWIKFNENQLHRLVDEGNVVVVDVTADWCITCKFNKLRVFHDADVMKKIQQDKVFAMRADITKPNEEVLQFIHKKGRYAIPFNAVYGPKAPEGLLTSELLSKEELFKLIDQASKN